jgi:hypothetical protein
MTDEELRAIKARAQARSAGTFQGEPIVWDEDADILALVAEIERYRDFSVVNWGDSPIAQFIAACDQLRVIAKSLRYDGYVAMANQIEKHVSVIREYHDRERETEQTHG